MSDRDIVTDHLSIGSIDPALWDQLYGFLDTGANQEVVDYLAGGGDPNLRNREQGWTLLHAAAFKDRRTVVEELIARGADVDAVRSGDNFTPLAEAAHKAHIGCLRVLLAAGASLDCRPLGMSLLESLRHAQKQSEEVRRILLAARTPSVDHEQ